MAIDIASVGSLLPVNSVNNLFGTSDTEKKGGVSSFEALLSSAMGMIKETEDYTNKAEDAELQYMLGLNDSVSDLLIAQTKANMSLQYTVAVRNAVMDAYREIMQLQF